MGVLLPKVGVARACKNPGFAIAASVACVWGLGGKNMLDGLADKAMTTGDKNNVRHVVRVYAG